MVYFKRLLKFRHMDFEFAIWQMSFLLVAPQKLLQIRKDTPNSTTNCAVIQVEINMQQIDTVFSNFRYKNFHYQKQTKRRWARDDPAFLVLLSGFLLLSSIGFALVLHLGVLGFLKFLLWVVFVDCIGVGLLLATVMWIVANKFFRVPSMEGGDQWVEWAYAFDVHLNGFFSLMVMLHGVQLVLVVVFMAVLSYQGVIFVIMADILWLVAIGYYMYITFLGYSTLPFLQNTVYLLYAFLPVTILILISIPMQLNWTVIWTNFFKSL